MIALYQNTCSKNLRLGNRLNNHGSPLGKNILKGPKGQQIYLEHDNDYYWRLLIGQFPEPFMISFLASRPVKFQQKRL